LDKLRPRSSPYSSLLTFVTDRLGHDFRYAISTDKIRKELKWSPQETFESGIKKTLAYFMKDD